MHPMMNAVLMGELFGGMARYKALRCLYEQPARAFGTASWRGPPA